MTTIISWNVNGLRALHRSGDWEWLIKTSPDVFCLQEIKAEKEQLPDEIQAPKGYHAFFHSSQERKGYSGTALYSKEEPKNVVYGLPDAPELDRHGRLITAYFKTFVCITGYFPNGRSKTAPLDYKLSFYDAVLEYIEKLRSVGHAVVINGDFNVAHEAIDLARPEANKNNTGFLPQERAWFDELIAAGYIDVFRHLYPNKKDVYTYWDQITRARERNVGWRIDYFVISPDLEPKVKKCIVHTGVYGSDHCPIELHIDV